MVDLDVFRIIIQIMSNLTIKKKISTLQPKKSALIPRLIKCYVCNQHFQSQNQFDLHYKAHQNKLNRTNIDEIQRKTQESFRKSKHTNLLNRTHAVLPQEKEKIKENLIQDKQLDKKQDCLDERQEKEIQEALKESQILLEKIQFITQVPLSQNHEKVQEEQEQDVQFFEKTIQGQKILHQTIKKANKDSNLEKLILQTNFQTRYFQNYQDQLLHLRMLASYAVNPASVSKIMDIRKKICADIYNDLKKHFQVEEGSQKQRTKKMIEVQITQNTGQVKFCAECYSQIGGMDDLYELQCGQNYHPECWNGYYYS